MDLLEPLVSGGELRQLNLCRIHLQVTLLSEITTGDGLQIAPEAWLGQHHANVRNIHNFPVQPNVPDSFWSLWRRTLQGLCTQHRHLRSPLGSWLPSARSRLLWWFDPRLEQLYKTDGTQCWEYKRRPGKATRQAVHRFSEPALLTLSIPLECQPCTVSPTRSGYNVHSWDGIISAPTLAPAHSFESFIAQHNEFAWLFRHVQVTGSMLQLGHDIRHGHVVGITDGSFKDNHGTASWRIINPARPDNAISSSCITPGQPEQLGSYRSELSGLYGTIVTVNLLTEFLQLTEGTITLACDNLSAIRQASYFHDGTSPLKTADYDLIVAIQSMQNAPLTWLHQHVLGHQDTKSDKPLSQLESLNVEMDRAAKAHWELTKTTARADRIHFFSHEPWSVSIGGTKITSNLGDQIRDWCQRPRIQRYWVEKGRFTELQLHELDYDAAGKALRSAPLETRRKVTKHTSGYCAVNKMMFRWNKRDTEQCPRCDALIEDSSHVWHCNGKESNSKWEKALATLRHDLSMCGTDPHLTTIIISRLTTWQSQSEPQDLRALIPESYQLLTQTQDDHGWENFFLGLPCLGWVTIQDIYFQRMASHQSGSRWLTAIIKKQWKIAWDIWDYRNDILHDNDDGILATANKALLTQEYQLGPPTSKERPLFRIQLAQLLLKTPPHQASWLHAVQHARQRQARRDDAQLQMRRFMSNFLQAYR